MVVYRYLLLIDEDTLVRRNVESPKMERYDSDSKEWVSDWSLSEIFTGDVRVRKITEKEAEKIIKGKSNGY